MSHSGSSPLIAVDIGNSRIKLGCFGGSPPESNLPVPNHVLELPAGSFDPTALDAWLETLRVKSTAAEWWVASVNHSPTERLVGWLHDRGLQAAEHTSAAGFHLLEHDDLPLAINVLEPERVGIDRLLGAVAVNRLRNNMRGAVIIGVGTAITVDLVSSSGAFLGGAILPGIAISAQAMHDFTDLLPLIPMEELADAPPALGTSTVEAMRSGLYWGAVGGMKELTVRLTDSLGPSISPDERPEVFLTGGAAPGVVGYLAAGAKHVPNLVLCGIALVAE